MHIISILFFALTASSDSLIVGISYGAKKIHIDLFNNIIVSAIAGFGTMAAMLLGSILNILIPYRLEEVIGSALLILFGLYMLFSAFRSKDEENSLLYKEKANKQVQYCNRALRNPEILDKNLSKVIEFNESIVLGLILCLNNVGLGIGASMTGLNIYLTSSLSFIFSIVFLHLGCLIGKKIISNNFNRYANIFSALIIILLGLYELTI